MEKKASDTFAFDLENRLDDFFNDSIPSQNDPPADEPPAPKADLPLKDLKSTILSIDWEITDEALATFIRQVDGLVEPYANDKVVLTLLKILKSLGKYVRAHKSKAHPDTIKRILAVFATLEESVTNDKLDQSQKEKLLQEEVRQFKLLKARIIQPKSPNATGRGHQQIAAAEKSGLDAVIKAIESLKSLMTSELSAIRKEIAQLRKK